MLPSVSNISSHIAYAMALRNIITLELLVSEKKSIVRFFFSVLDLKREKFAKCNLVYIVVLCTHPCEVVPCKIDFLAFKE